MNCCLFRLPPPFLRNTPWSVHLLLKTVCPDRGRTLMSAWRFPIRLVAPWCPSAYGTSAHGAILFNDYWHKAPETCLQKTGPVANAIHGLGAPSRPPESKYGAYNIMTFPREPAYIQVRAHQPQNTAETFISSTQRSLERSPVGICSQLL